MIEEKKKAKKIVKRHLWHSIVICFIVSTLLTFGYKYNTENRIRNYDYSRIYTLKTSNNLDVVEERMERTRINKITKKITNYKPTRGLLSTYFNQITGTGSIVIGVLNANNQYIFKNSIPSLVIMILGIVISVFVYVFIVNVITIGKNRYFIEHHSYDSATYDKLFFVYRVNKTKNVALIMIRMKIQKLLWYLTIVGGIIKHYEYSMIPYILAENPEISPKECFELSKKMTDGYKLKIFKTDLSLIGWYILSGLTLGLSNILYFNPYKECIYAEIYMSLRSKVSSPLLKDEYLDKTGDKYNPENYFLKELKKEKVLKINYKVDYKLDNLILMFFIFGIFGWIWEINYRLFNHGVFVNRGMLHGPILPIYGVGGIIILVFLKRFRNNPRRLFITAFTVCGVIEYLTSFLLEKAFKMSWWNYTGYFLNINGRVCLEGLLVFGLAGWLATYYTAPILNNLFNKITEKKKMIVIIILVTIFTIDLSYSIVSPNSGKGISKKISYNIINIGDIKDERARLLF